MSSKLMRTIPFHTSSGYSLEYRVLNRVYSYIYKYIYIYTYIHIYILLNPHEPIPVDNRDTWISSNNNLDIPNAYNCQ